MLQAPLFLGLKFRFRVQGSDGFRVEGLGLEGFRVWGV